jgi:NAD(P)-dependent dehydrogenase (short-subunit alcohol dehydrogenase family)
MKDLAGRVAVVTGAASGIGRALAHRLAGEGMRVALGDVDTDALRRVADELRDAGQSAIAVACDVSRLDDVARLARETLAAFDRVDVLCNNAGVARHTGEAIWELTDKDWQWLLGVNVWGVIHGVRVFVPIMLAQPEGGHVVNTASVAGLVSGGGAYGATKHAVVALSENLYLELERRTPRVGVSCLCPGLVASRIVDGEAQRPAHLREDHRTETADQLAHRSRIAERTASLGRDPAATAALVVDGIRADRFYLVEDDPPIYVSVGERIADRFEDLQRGTNPRGRLLR